MLLPLARAPASLTSTAPTTSPSAAATNTPTKPRLEGNGGFQTEFTNSAVVTLTAGTHNGAGRITKVVLWDLTRNAIIPGYEDLEDGVVLNTTSLPSLFTIMAEASQDAEGLHFYLAGNGVQLLHVANDRPFVLNSKSSSGWAFEPSNEPYTLEMKPFVFDWSASAPEFGSTVQMQIFVTEQ